MPEVSVTISGLSPEEAEELLASLGEEEEEVSASKKRSSKSSKKKSRDEDPDEDEDEDDDEDSDEDEDDDEDDDSDDDDEDDDSDEDEDDDDEDEVFDKKSLKAKGKSDLVDIAKGMKLRKLDGLGKTELVDKILKAQARKS